MFDLNEPPSNEENTDEFIGQNGDDSIFLFTPFVGQTFLSEEEAWVFYHNYAPLHGFRIRKDRFQKQDGVITRRDFYCHRSRSQPLKEIDPNKEQRNRVSIRLRFLPANRMISEEDEKHILILKEAGLTVDVAVREIIQRQSHDNMSPICKINVLKIKSPLEKKKASEILTPFPYEKFKEECDRSSQYSIISSSGYDFIVRYYANDKSRCHKVFWDGNIAMCSCKQYEFLGIICRHILQIFHQKDCHEVPSTYFPSRWRLDGSTSSTDQVPDEQITQSNALITDDDITCPPKSKPK
ncbi:Protein FAR1-RELATED SEQUENCE 11 [Bienertia sinuspersici]